MFEWYKSKELAEFRKKELGNLFPNLYVDISPSEVDSSRKTRTVLFADWKREKNMNEALRGQKFSHAEIVKWLLRERGK